MSNYKYTILIPQQAYETLGVQISLEAAAVMSLLQEVAGITAYANNSFKESGKTYYWFSHIDIIGNLPMIFATRMLPTELTDEAKGKAESNIIASYKKRLRRVMNELIEIGLLEAHPNNREKTMSYYCFTEMSDMLITSYKNIQGAKEPRTKTYKVSDRPRTKTYKVGHATSDKNVPLSVNKDLLINKDESVNNEPAPEKSFELQSEEESNKEPKAVSLKNKLTITDDDDEAAEAFATLLTEQAEYFTKKYAAYGFDKANIEQYADAIATQHFKSAKVLVVDEKEMKRQVKGWVNFIFKKVNEGISTPSVSNQNGFKTNGVIEPYSEGYLVKILSDIDKHWVKDLKDVSPQELADKLATWKERKANDETMSAAFPQFAQKRIKAANSLN